MASITSCQSGTEGEDGMFQRMSQAPHIPPRMSAPFPLALSTQRAEMSIPMAMCPQSLLGGRRSLWSKVESHTPEKPQSLSGREPRQCRQQEGCRGMNSLSSLCQQLTRPLSDREHTLSPGW